MVFFVKVKEVYVVQCVFKMNNVKDVKKLQNVFEVIVVDFVIFCICIVQVFDYGFM